MSVSRVLFGVIVASILASVSGCTVQASVKTKTRFVEPNVTKEDAADWDGTAPISINIQGVGASVNGGVFVTADANATKVKATARMLAMANDDDKASADLSIVDAKNSFTITSSSTGITVACGHGSSHGSSNAGESGCEHIAITIPAGSDTKPLSLTVLGGSGDLNLQLAAATIKNLGANANGADTTAVLPATKGGTISLVSESFDINCTMSPATWAADEVIVQTASTDPKDLVIPSDVKNGAGAGGRGTAGTGLASLKLTAKGGLGSIVLK